MATSSTFPEGTFKWTLPSISEEKQTLLCTGFLRNYSVVLNSSILAHDIINLCAQYFYPNDLVTLNDIKLSPIGQCFHSSVFRMFSFKWYLEVSPNGYKTRDAGDVHLVLHLITLPKHISSIILTRTVSFLEGNAGTSQRLIRKFTKDKLKTGKAGITKTTALQQHEAVTFAVDIQLIEVCHVNGFDITDKYASIEKNGASSRNSDQKTDHMGMNVRVDKNDLQKLINDRFEQLNKKIDDFQKQWVNIGNNRMNNGNKIIKSWLDEIGLTQYSNTFIENGIDDLSVVKLLTTDVLKQIGIAKIGHQMKILHQVRILNSAEKSEKIQRNDIDRDAFLI